jgi:hypothetical protein
LQPRLLDKQQQQQQTVSGDENLALWTKGKKKTGRGGRQGPKFGAPPQGGESSKQQWAEERHEHSEMLCLWRDGSLCRTVSQEEEEVGWVSNDSRGDRVQEKFARECAFITTLSAITPSSTRWGDRVEEDRLMHNSDSEGD